MVLVKVGHDSRQDASGDARQLLGRALVDRHKAHVGTEDMLS